MTFVYRSVKGSPLTSLEGDNNFFYVEELHDATEVFKNDAETSESNASTSESNALAYKDKAQEWAENPEDVEVETGQYSAKHYSIKASEFAGPWEAWKGNWVAGSYTALDGVAHNGSSFIANKDTTEEPSLSAVDWDILSQKGDQGETGPQGLQGETGPQGLQGETGPQGDPWDQWQGDWVAGAYLYLDGVQHNGSSWIANKNTSEEPSISAVDWDLLAEKGTDGTGTGDVIGPASGVTDNFTSFADTTGKNIKDSGKNASDFVASSEFTQDGSILVGTGAGTFQEETGATLRASIGLGNVSNVSTDDTAYDATTWDGNTDAATKNAIRDKFESLSSITLEQLHATALSF